MSGTTKALESIAEYFGRLGKGASEATKQFGEQPSWVKRDRALLTQEAAKLDVQPNPAQNVPLWERVQARKLAEESEGVNPAHAPDEGMDEFEMRDFAPEVPEDLAVRELEDFGLAPEPAIIKELSKLDKGTVPDLRPWRVHKGDVEDTEGVVLNALSRADTKEARYVSKATGLRPDALGMGWLSEDALRTTARVAARQGENGRYVGAMNLDDVADLMAYDRFDPTVVPPKPGSFLGTKPVVIVVKEQGKVGKVLRVTGPDQLASRKTPDALGGANVPVIIQSEAGMPIKGLRALVYEDKDRGIRKLFSPPHVKDWSYEADFTDPLNPRWAAEQPRSPQEVRDALSTMFSAEGISLGSTIAKKLKDFQALVEPDEYFAQGHRLLKKKLFNWMRNTKNFQEEGSFIGGAGQQSLDIGFQFAEEEVRQAALAEQRSFYKTFAEGDPVVFERMRHFTYDSPYKLSLWGETDPHLKDMPIIFFHTDQQFFNAERVSGDAVLAQFDIPAEVGYHAAPMKRQAAYLEAGKGSSEKTMLLHYKTANENWHGAIKRAKEMVPSGKELVEEKLQRVWATTLDLENPHLNKSGVDIQAAFDNEFGKKGWKADGMADDEAAQAADATAWLADLMITYLNAWRQTSQTSFIFRGKRPLILQDMSSFDPVEVAKQLLTFDQFEPYKARLTNIVNSGNDVEAWKTVVKTNNKWGVKDYGDTHKDLVNIMESEGFDHIMYVNYHELTGLPSIITWKQEHMKFSWAPFFSRRSNNPNYAALPFLPFGAPGDKENKNE